MNSSDTCLTRDEFREGVFTRDKHSCVICGSGKDIDAHHIINRRLWDNGGYYIDNGVTLCAEHHLLAEQTLLSCEELRSKSKIKNVLIPEHLAQDEGERYDTWGNQLMPTDIPMRQLGVDKGEYCPKGSTGDRFRF